MTALPPPALDLDALRERLLAGERAALARAITLAESRRADHRAAARTLIDAVLPHTGRAVRVGITGVPGVGKSTLIDALGSLLTGAGRGGRRRGGTRSERRHKLGRFRADCPVTVKIVP